MKIVVLDGYTENPGDLSWEGLAALGELTVYDRTSLTDENETIARIGDAEVVYTNKTPITKTVIDACPNMKFISVLATGYNVVDYVHAREKGIPVTNVPTYGTAAVGQFAIALLLEICHHVAHHSDAVHAGRWETSADWCFWDYPLIELADKTMGIIGFGRIGRAVGKIAKAFGMNVLAYNRSRCAEGEAIGQYVDLDTLLRESDVVSLHCPLTPQTQEIIGSEALVKMKDGAILLNTARGPLIDEQAIADALRSGKLRGFGGDVVCSEPMAEDNPLLGTPNCIVTPHMAWAPIESRQRIMDCTQRSIAAFLAGSPINTVNM